MGRTLFLFLLLITGNLRAEEKSEEKPFEPALVADMDRISVDMLSSEANQFLQAAVMISADNKAPQLEKDRQKLQNQKERAEALYRRAATTLEDLLEHNAAYEVAVADIEVNNGTRQVARLRAELSKLQVLEIGKTGSNPLKEAAASQLALLQGLLKMATAGHQRATALVKLTGVRASIGAKLHQGKAMSTEDFENRLLAQDRARTALVTAEAEIAGAKLAVTAAKRTYERVSNGSYHRLFE